MQACHFPAERRSLQLHNAQRAFAALSASDAAGIRRHRPEALVDGDREATLGFLATLLLHFQVPYRNHLRGFCTHFWELTRPLILAQMLRLRSHTSAILGCIFP